MTPRKQILQELSKIHDTAGPDAFKQPAQLPGFERDPGKYREAVNGLLKDQLISGRQDPNGNLIVGLNGARMPAVQKELRRWYQAPLLWMAVLLAVAGVSATLIF